MDSSGVILTPEGTFSQLLRMKSLSGSVFSPERKFLRGWQKRSFLTITPIDKYPISGMLLHGCVRRGQ